MTTALRIVLKGTACLALMLLTSCASEALERAVYAQDLEGVRRALDQGANPNHRVVETQFLGALVDMQLNFINQSAILVEAVRTGNVEITLALLEADADTTAKDFYGKTALCAAVLMWPNGTELVGLLLDHGADPDLASGFGPVTPLLEAMWYGHLDTALLLYPIAQHPEFDDHDRIHLTRNDFGPLVAAVADMYQRGEFPSTDESLAEFPAATRAILLGRLDDLRQLSAERSEVLEARDRFNFTPLMWAASRFGSEEMTRLLLEAGADARAEGDGRWTALYAAVESERADTVRLLTRAGADPNVKVQFEMERPTLLMIAASGRRADVVQALLDAGADPIVAVNNGETTALSRAAYNPSDDRIAIEAMIREAVESRNAPDSDG